MSRKKKFEQSETRPKGAEKYWKCSKRGTHNGEVVAKSVKLPTGRILTRNQPNSFQISFYRALIDIGFYQGTLSSQWKDRILKEKVSRFRTVGYIRTYLYYGRMVRTHPPCHGVPSITNVQLPEEILFSRYNPIIRTFFEVVPTFNCN